MTSNEMIQMYTVEKTVSIMLGIKIFKYSAFLMCFFMYIKFFKMIIALSSKLHM